MTGLGPPESIVENELHSSFLLRSSRAKRKGHYADSTARLCSPRRHYRVAIATTASAAAVLIKRALPPRRLPCALAALGAQPMAAYIDMEEHSAAPALRRAQRHIAHTCRRPGPMRRPGRQWLHAARGPPRRCGAQRSLSPAGRRVHATLIPALAMRASAFVGQAGVA
jgi:hypothetical protein